MKRKEKRITILGLSVLMCSLFLVIIPVTAIAAEQDDFVLGIYGNANEDDTIDMRDLTYVKLIFFGKKPETEFADAKCDGKINPLDFIQIKLIIVGKEKELTIVGEPRYGKIVTVQKPIKRIVVSGGEAAEIIIALRAKDKVVGSSDDVVRPKKRKALFRSFSRLPNIGTFWRPDCEAILNLDPDIVIGADWSPPPSVLEDKLPDITMIRLGFYKPLRMTENIRKLGYILNMKDNANELINFYEGYLNTISERVELSEDNKPRVYIEHFAAYRTYNKGMGCHQVCTLAGGINIAADIPDLPPGSQPQNPMIDPEWVLEQNPDIVVKMARKVGYDIDDPSEMKALRNEIMDRPGWGHIKAVKEGKVYVASGDVTYGPGNYIGIIYLAKWFHPALFEDLDPQAIHQEYLDKFLRIDYDLDKHGVFVYPPLAS